MYIDIQRILDDRQRGSALNAKSLFIHSKSHAFNPLSTPIRLWYTLMQMCGIYLFISVPARIAFNPFLVMTHWFNLSVDVTIDSLLILNIMITFNVAYVNKQSRWVSNHTKIIKHYLSGDLPMDFLAGGHAYDILLCMCVQPFLLCE